MSKVEELRGSLEEAIGCYDVFGDHKISLAMSGMITNLIAAAREEGRAEERERIVCGSQRFPKGEYVVDSDYISMVFSHDGIGEAMTDCELFIIPASVLAPAPKEGK